MTTSMGCESVHVTVEAAARAYAAQQQGAIQVRGGWVGDGLRRGRGWQGYGEALLQEGLLVQVGDGYRLATAEHVAPAAPVVPAELVPVAASAPPPQPVTPPPPPLVPLYPPMVPPPPPPPVVLRVCGCSPGGHHPTDCLLGLAQTTEGRTELRRQILNLQKSLREGLTTEAIASAEIGRLRALLKGAQVPAVEPALVPQVEPALVPAVVPASASPPSREELLRRLAAARQAREQNTKDVAAGRAEPGLVVANRLWEDEQRAMDAVFDHDRAKLEAEWAAVDADPARRQAEVERRALEEPKGGGSGSKPGRARRRALNAVQLHALSLSRLSGGHEAQDQRYIDSLDEYFKGEVSHAG